MRAREIRKKWIKTLKKMVSIWKNLIGNLKNSCPGIEETYSAIWRILFKKFKTSAPKTWRNPIRNFKKSAKKSGKPWSGNLFRSSGTLCGNPENPDQKFQEIWWKIRRTWSGIWKNPVQEFEEPCAAIRRTPIGNLKKSCSGIEAPLFRDLKTLPGILKNSAQKTRRTFPGNPEYPLRKLEQISFSICRNKPLSFKKYSHQNEVKN